MSVMCGREIRCEGANLCLKIDFFVTVFWYLCSTAGRSYFDPLCTYKSMSFKGGMYRSIDITSQLLNEKFQ
jgi:hypothetical protein